MRVHAIDFNSSSAPESAVTHDRPVCGNAKRSGDAPSKPGSSPWLGIDHVAIVDNESTDATQDVLMEFDDAITVTTIRDPADRFAALPGLLARIEVCRFERPLLHHYMIDGEDSFVEKAKALERWNPQVRGQSQRNEPITVRDFEMKWWCVYQFKGEAALRDYHREEYVVSPSSLPIHIERGELVEDTEFADFKRFRSDVRRNVSTN